MANVRKAQRALEKYRRAGLTPEGEAWLLTAIDPYHDLPLHPTGRPEGVVADSIVQAVRLQYEIKAPGTVSGNWDCHLVIDPSSNSLQREITTIGGCAGIVSDDRTAVAGATFGGVTVISTESGRGTAPGAGNFANDAALTSIKAVAPDISYFEGPHRIVALGFEVTNTTAELYKQGSVTTWRMANALLQKSNLMLWEKYDHSAIVTQPFVTDVYAYWPNTVSSARLLPGSQTWAAAEGCYVVAAQESSQNPITRLQPNQQVITNSWDASALDLNVDAWAGPALVNLGVNASPSGTRRVHPAFSQSPFTMAGAFFTGLSNQSTLTLTVNVFIERFPTLAQLDLVTLAQPAPRFDPIALELYSQILSEMPTGVMVKENGLGDWFVEAVSTVAPLISGALSAIPHPLAQGAAMAANMAGKMADKYAIKASPSGDGKALKTQRKQQRKANKSKAKQAMSRK